MVKLILGIALTAIGAIGIAVGVFRETGSQRRKYSGWLSQVLGMGGSLVTAVGVVLLLMLTQPSAAEVAKQHEAKVVAITQIAPHLTEIGYKGSADRDMNTESLYAFNDNQLMTAGSVEIRLRDGSMGYLHIQLYDVGWRAGCFVDGEFELFDDGVAARKLTATGGCLDFRNNFSGS